MAKEEPCDCLDYQQQLSECKDSKCNQCEEDKKVAIIAIQKLEKKVFALTIIIAITITLIGKEFADKIMESFSSFEKITEKVESAIPNSNETKEGETREVSMNYDFSSFWFS